MVIEVIAGASYRARRRVLQWPLEEPRDVVTRLNAELVAVLGDPQLLALFAKMNVTPTPGTPEAFGAYIAQEWQRWQRFAAQSGVNLAD